MSKADDTRTPPKPAPRAAKGSDDAEGVVLFDPTPRPLPHRVGAPPGADRGRSRPLLAAFLAVVIGAGAYQAYRTGVFAAAEPEPPPIMRPVPEVAPVVPNSLTPLGPESLQGRAGSALLLEVRARDSGGRPVVDSLVRFEVASGGGLLDLDTARTDQEGVARGSLTLPRRAGTVVVLASLGHPEIETRLVVNVRPGPPARLVAGEGDGQRAQVGQLLSTDPSVTLYDDEGVPVPDASVAFSVISGGGVFAPARARTDSLGVASVLWRLGPAAGTQQLRVAAVGVDESVTFTATATPLPTDGNRLPVEAGPVTVQRRDYTVGGAHVCALVGGAVQCRGANDQGQRGTWESTRFVALATGISHACGLEATGEAACWGANEGGQLGDGTRTNRSSPAAVGTELRFSSLTAGATHTCGVAGGGVPACWGQNLNGQLGDGSRTDARFPKAVGGGVLFRAVVAGWDHTCGLTENGNAFCWGLNGEGQLGDGSRLDRLLPTLVRADIESLAAGSAHTCGVSGSEVLCWGDNSAGQLGDGTTTGRPQPTRVPGLTSVAQVVAGAVHTCALLDDGSARCWGQNLHGQLGDGTTTNRSTPTAVEGGLRFRALYAGGALTCGFTTDGVEYCWGLNQSGQLGDGTRESRSLPTAVQR
jgi:alpha-tubulin suppressor-like RCC1 family protein